MGSLSGTVAPFCPGTNPYGFVTRKSKEEQEECIHCEHDKKLICNITGEPSTLAKQCCRCGKMTRRDDNITIIHPMPNDTPPNTPYIHKQPKTDAQIQAEADILQRKRIANIQKRLMKEEGDLTLNTYWKNKAKKLGITVEELMERRRNDGLS